MSAPTTEPTSTSTIWTIDPRHTAIDFTVRFLKLSSVRGYFTDYHGDIVFDRDETKSSVRVAIATTSIETGDQHRNAHLRTADFLDAAAHPTITFVSKNVRSTGGEDLRIIGDLTIRGVTREIAIDATYLGRDRLPDGREVIAFEGSTVIKRKDYGVSFNFAVDRGAVMIGDDVKISLDVQAIRTS